MLLLFKNLNWKIVIAVKFTSYLKLAATGSVRSDEEAEEVPVSTDDPIVEADIGKAAHGSKTDDEVVQR